MSLRNLKANVIFFSLIFITTSFPSTKYVIGAHYAGFFSSFNSVLNHLNYCDIHNKIPVVNWQRSGFMVPQGFNGSNDVWGYYFEPVSSLKYNPGDDIYGDYSPDNYHFYFSTIDQNTRGRAHYLIKKYIRIRPMIQRKIYSFFNKYMKGKKTIGIHLRGTDKFLEEKPVPVELMLEEAFKYADDQTQFYIATEDNKIYEQAIKILGSKAISYNAHRENNSNWSWFLHHPNKAKIGEDVLIEMKLLSLCNVRLIHTYSNVSAAVLYFNPKLPNSIMVNTRFRKISKLPNESNPKFVTILAAYD